MVRDFIHGKTHKSTPEVNLYPQIEVEYKRGTHPRLVLYSNEIEIGTRDLKGITSADTLRDILKEEGLRRENLDFVHEDL